MSGMYEKSIRDEFTHQADSFARSPVPGRLAFAAVEFDPTGVGMAASSAR